MQTVLISCDKSVIEQVVDKHAENRSIIFSSFHPDAARLIRTMQMSYPVRLLL